MIVSASRRTDIPAFHADWFFERLKEGHALSVNPMNPKQVRQVDLSPEAVDGFVFWTKNPQPMLSRLGRLSPYPFYFQCTITGHGQDLEPCVPGKEAPVPPAFLALADAIGPQRFIWRYDPICLSPLYTVEYHTQRFDAMARILSGRAQRCTISFLDIYAKTSKRLAQQGIRPPSEAEAMALAASFAKSAREAGMHVAACAEEMDLAAFGIGRGRCIDAELLMALSGRKISRAKDPAQRPACGCARSADIGTYGTCGHGCVYCYA